MESCVIHGVKLAIVFDSHELPNSQLLASPQHKGLPVFVVAIRAEFVDNRGQCFGQSPVDTIRGEPQELRLPPEYLRPREVLANDKGRVE